MVVLFIIKIFNERLKQMKNLNVLNQTQKQEELKEINELKFKYIFLSLQNESGVSRS